MIKLSTSFVFIFLSLVIRQAECSHFRGGSITAMPVNQTSTQVTFEFTMNLAWRLSTSSAYFCNQTTINNNQLTGPSTDTLNCRRIGNLTCSNVLATCDTHCKFFSPTVGGYDWTYGEKKFFVTTPFVQYYEASFASSGWMALAGGGSSGSWEVRLRIDTRVRNDTGLINTTPITTIPPVITFRRGVLITIPIIWADSDVGDDVRCRWAQLSRAECGGVCQDNPNPANRPKAVPPATLNETSCLLTFDGTQNTSVVGYYAVALQIEDFMTPQDTIPMSSVPLQFLINLVSSTSTCTQAPIFVGSRPAFGCFATGIGIQYTDQMIAQVQCPNSTIISIQVLGLGGSSVSTLNAVTGTSNQWMVNINWTPTQKQYGPNVVCGFATDSTFLVAFNCYTIIAGITPPSIALGTQTPTGLISSTHVNNGQIKWSIDLDQTVIQGVAGQFINIYHSNGTLYDRIDSAAGTVTISNYTLEFTTSSNFTFDDYYITLDYGVVRGSLFCNPYSNELSNSSIWTFTINATLTTQTSTTTTTTTVAITQGVVGPGGMGGNSSKSGGDDSSNMGAVIGGIIGALAALGGIGAGIFFAIRWLKRRKEDKVRKYDDMRMFESATPSASSRNSSQTPSYRRSFDSNEIRSNSVTTDRSVVEMPSSNKTRVAGFNVRDRQILLNANVPTQVQIQIPLRPPPKNKMMGPLIKDKNFNYPLEDGIKAYILQNK